MPDADTTTSLQQQLVAHRATLAILLRQVAIHTAAYAPPAQLSGVAEARREIARLKAALRAAGVAVENEESDEAAPEEETGAHGAPSATVLIGRDQLNAQSSQGFINQAQNVTQNFNEALAPPLIPACPAPNAAQLFGRDEMISLLAGRLIVGQGAVALYAVRGLPGVGKTDLLRATGRDARITAHFAGGVLYAELGPTPSPSSILRRWIAELGQRAPQSDDPETLAAVVRAALRERRALLILDDVWESSLSAARALRECGSPACRVLTSSRSAQVAREAALGAEPLTLDVLIPTAALALLRGHASVVVARDETGAAELTQALGYLPLALKLAGHLLANDRRSQQPIPALLATWRARLNELRGHESRPSPPLLPQRERGQGGEGQLSLDAIIGLSYDALPDDATRAAAAALAAFGAMPLDWDWDAMAAVWATDEAATVALEQALVGCGLVEWDEVTRRYSLHATIHAFLERRAELVVYERHVAYYAKLMLQHGVETLGRLKGDIDVALATLDREIEQMKRAQRLAAGSEQTPFWDTRLIDYAFACATYFSLRGRYEEWIAWSDTGGQAAQRQSRERDAAAMLEMQALIYNLIGRFDKAVVSYKQASSIYQRLKKEADTGRLLGNLGLIYYSQGRYEEALDHHQQSLEIKRRIGATAGIARTLGNLGNVYSSQGRYEEALDHYQQSLTISRGIGDTAGIALTLGNLGSIYDDQRRYEEALDHHQQSLEIKRRIGDSAGIAGTLGNLGLIYYSQGHYEEAIDHYQQSLAITRRIGDMRTTANNIWNLGLLYEKLGDPVQALSLIGEAAQIAERIGIPQAAEFRVEAERLRGGDGPATGDSEPPTGDD